MQKQNLAFRSPLMNTAGFLGFAPNTRSGVELESLGAFVTNPISRHARSPAGGAACLGTAGGILLHNGLPNPGIRRVIRAEAERWATAGLPIIVHLIPAAAEEAAEMTRLLEGRENILAVEISLPPQCSLVEGRAIIAAAAGELPVIAQIPAERMLEWGAACMEAGAAALGMAACRGALAGRGGNIVHGRLYGPAQFPQALHTVEAAARAGLPVIGAGGVCEQKLVQVMLAAGALAVQVDTILWKLDALPEG